MKSLKTLLLLLVSLNVQGLTDVQHPDLSKSATAIQ